MTEFDVAELEHQLGPQLRHTLRAVAESVTDDGDQLAVVPVTRHRRRALPRRVALAAAAAVVVIVGVVAGLRPGSGDDAAWAAEALAVAEAAPRLLVSTTGWEVTRADEFSVELGELTFTGPGGELGLAWGTGTDGGYEDRLAEWTSGAERLDDTTVAGHPAAVFASGDADHPHFVALWRDGGYGVEARGDFPDVDAFLDVARALETVDVDTWLSAMPATAVRAENRAAAVQQMLADIPVPAGFDTESLTDGETVSDRYQLGADVTARVACAWIEQWVDATASGDAAAATQAVDAMATSHDWAVLGEMQTGGAWAQSIWELADAIATDGTIDAGLPDIPVADSYDDTLGCTRR